MSYLNTIPTAVIQNKINQYSPSTWDIRIRCEFNEDQATVDNESWPYNEDDWVNYNHSVYVHFEIPIEMYNRYNTLENFENAIGLTAMGNHNGWVYGSDNLLQEYVAHGDGDENVVHFIEPRGGGELMMEAYNGVEREDLDGGSIEYIVNFEYDVNLPPLWEGGHFYDEDEWDGIINTMKWHTAENMSRFCTEFLPNPNQAINVPPNPHNLARWKLQNNACCEANWWRNLFNNNGEGVLPVQNNTAVNVMGNWLVNEKPELKF